MWLLDVVRSLLYATYMRLLRHDTDSYPCGTMKSARPQILLQEVEESGHGAPVGGGHSATGNGPVPFTGLPEPLEDDGKSFFRHQSEYIWNLSIGRRPLMNGSFDFFIDVFLRGS